MLSVPIPGEPGLAVSKDGCHLPLHRFQVSVLHLGHASFSSLLTAEVPQGWSLGNQSGTQMQILSPVETGTLGWDPAVCFNKLSIRLFPFGLFCSLSFFSLPSLPLLPPLPQL